MKKAFVIFFLTLLSFLATTSNSMALQNQTFYIQKMDRVCDSQQDPGPCCHIIEGIDGKNKAKIEDTPWCSPLAIDESGSSNQQKFEPGDTIILRGNFNLPNLKYEGEFGVDRKPRVVRSGVLGSPITIKADGEVTIYATTHPDDVAEYFLLLGDDDSSTNFPIIPTIRLSGDYINWEGINFVGYIDDNYGDRNYAHFGLLNSNGDYSNVENSIFQGFADDILSIGLTMSGNYPKISNSEFTCNIGQDFENSSEGLRGDGLSIKLSSNAHVVDNRFYDCGHDLLVMKGSDGALVERNYFTNPLHTIIGAPDRTSNATIKNNIFYRWNEFPTSAMSQLDGTAINNLKDASGIKIYNNIFYKSFNNGRGIGMSSSSAIGVENVVIANNIFYDVSHRPINMGFSDPYGLYNNVVFQSDVKIYNNLISGTTPSNNGSDFSSPITFRLPVDNLPSNFDFSDFASNGNEIKNNLINPLIDSSGSPIAISITNRHQNETITFDVAMGNSQLTGVDYNIESAPFITINSDNEPYFSIRNGSPLIGHGQCSDQAIIERDDYYGFIRDSDYCNIGPFEGPCPTDYTVSDNSITELRNYIAQNTIVTDENNAIVIESDASVIFNAGTSIELNPGFETKSEAYFETNLDGCIAANQASSKMVDRFLENEKDLDLSSEFPDYNDLPPSWDLKEPYPNPFAAVTRIRFQIPEFGHVNIQIFDILGRKVVDLVNREYPEGIHDVIWDGTVGGRNLSTGIFHIIIEGEGVSGSKFQKTTSVLHIQ